MTPEHQHSNPPTQQPLSRVSVIIPTWNRRDEVIACIDSLLRQKDVTLEIIVADDGSTDGTVAAVRGAFQDVNVVSGKGRYGPAFRRNQAIILSTGEFILNIDSDTEFQDAGTIARMVDHLNRDSRMGAIGGEIPLNFGNRDIAYGLNIGRYPYRIGAHSGQGLVECRVVASLNCMTRRAVTFAVGGFDPYYEFGGPDADFCQTISAAGYRNYVSYETAALHKASSVGRRDDISYRYCLGAARFDIKHRGMPFFLWQVAKYSITVGFNHVAWAAACVLRGNGRSRTYADKTHGGHILLKAYYWYLYHWRNAIRARRCNFLDPDNMQRFEMWKLPEAPCVSPCFGEGDIASACSVSSSPLVSVIIPTLNRKEDLEACLASLARQRGVAFEVVVMDDGSTDGTTEYFHAAHPGVRVVADGFNYGPGYRRNEAVVYHASGNHLLFADSDVVFDNPDVIRNMVQGLAADTGIGEIGGEIAAHGGEADFAVGVVLKSDGYPARIAARNGGPPMVCDYLASLNIMVRRKDFFRVGGFDPYYEWGAEDLDFGMRLKALGFRNVVGWEYAVRHMASSRARPANASYRYALGQMRYRLKQAGYLAGYALLVWRLIKYSVLFPPIKRWRGRGERAGAIVVKAAWWHLRNMPHAMKTRRSNYLAPTSMAAFLAWKKKNTP